MSALSWTSIKETQSIEAGKCEQQQKKWRQRSRRPAASSRLTLLDVASRFSFVVLSRLRSPVDLAIVSVRVTLLLSCDCVWIVSLLEGLAR